MTRAALGAGRLAEYLLGVSDRNEAERRSATRTPLEIWIEHQEQDAVYFQRSANLSAGGIFLEHSVPHPVGTRLSISFKLPGDGEPIRTLAEIVRVEQGATLGMHLKFLDLPTDVAERITRFVERQRTT